MRPLGKRLEPLKDSHGVSSVGPVMEYSEGGNKEGQQYHQQQQQQRAYLLPPQESRQPQHRIPQQQQYLQQQQPPSAYLPQAQPQAYPPRRHPYSQQYMMAAAAAQPILDREYAAALSQQQQQQQVAAAAAVAGQPFHPAYGTAAATTAAGAGYNRVQQQYVQQQFSYQQQLAMQQSLMSGAAGGAPPPQSYHPPPPQQHPPPPHHHAPPPPQPAQAAAAPYLQQTKVGRPQKDRPLIKLSVSLIDTYKTINTVYYEEREARKAARSKEKTKKGQGTNNSGWDDENYDYIITPGELFYDRYRIKERIGKGSFGQVVRAEDTQENKDVAIKIIKSKKPFLMQAKTEIELLTHLNDKDTDDQHNIGTYR